MPNCTKQDQTIKECPPQGGLFTTMRNYYNVFIYPNTLVKLFNDSKLPLYQAEMVRDALLTDDIYSPENIVIKEHQPHQLSLWDLRVPF